jgi:hypothetical protein
MSADALAPHGPEAGPAPAADTDPVAERAVAADPATVAEPAASGVTAQQPEPAATGDLARLSALPLEDRPAALTDIVRRLEDELDATEARLGGR